MAALQNEVRSGELAVSPALYPTPRRALAWMHHIEEHPSWPVLAQLPERTVAYIPLLHFTVKHLLELEKGKVFTSKALTSDLVPMKVGSIKLLWGEFEMVNQNLAVRVTKLA